MGSYELSERSRRLLATLVREYIETGEPVSSQLLAQRERPRRVVGDRPERAGPARRGAATCTSRTPRPDACRPTAATACSSTCCSRAASRRGRRPTSRTSSAQQAERSPLIDDLLASVSHLVSRAARHVGFALAGNAGRRAAAHRVRAARRLARAGRRGVARQPGHAEGRRRRRGRCVPTIWCRRRTT